MGLDFGVSGLGPRVSPTRPLENQMEKIKDIKWTLGLHGLLRGF